MLFYAWLLVIVACLFSMVMCIQNLFEYYCLDNRNNKKGNSETEERPSKACDFLCRFFSIF